MGNVILNYIHFYMDYIQDHKIYKLDYSKLKEYFDNKTVLITGGTGSFGHQMTNILLNNFDLKKLIIFSRDEFKQHLMQQRFPKSKYPQIRFFIGDVRDKERLKMAFKDVDIVYHAAALKHVPAIEYNPVEAIRTNIYGTENVIMAAIYNNVDRVIGISTDKCVNPVNMYGATKLCLEKLIINANVMSDSTKFSVLRYGNVLGSRGSVAPIFLKQKDTGILTVTDPKMTRFTITLSDAIDFVIECTTEMLGGEIYVPKLPSYNILQLAKVISDDAKINIIGKRPGEKLSEMMISENESYLTIDVGNKYVVMPNKEVNDHEKYIEKYGDNLCEDGFTYTSDKNELIKDEVLNYLLSTL